MKTYTSITHTSPLQFYSLLQATYPNYTATHDSALDRVTASGETWHWLATTNLTEDELTVIGTYKGSARDFEVAVQEFQQALEQQQMVYLLEYEQPTAYGYHSKYLEHPAHQMAEATQKVLVP